MASQLGESWLEHTLESSGMPDPRREGEPATIGVVTDAYIRNDLGLTPVEVDKYVNSALQNTAGDLHRKQQFGQEMLDYWREASAKAGMSTFADRRIKAMQQDLAREYDGGRDELADAVMAVRSSHEVPLTPTTCNWIIEMDHDGRMSRAMGVDVPELFADNPAYRADFKARSSERARASRSDIDFSIPPDPHSAPVRDVAATPRREPAARPTAGPRKPGMPERDRKLLQQAVEQGEITPIHRDLLEVIAEYHANKDTAGDQPGETTRPSGGHDGYDL